MTKKMFQIKTVGFALLAAITTAFSAENVDGWRNAKWGMTESEILAAFPGEAKLLAKPKRMMDRRVVGVQIEKLLVAQKPFSVDFLMGEKGVTLTSPEITAHKNEPISVATNAPLTGIVLRLANAESQGAEMVFETLEQSLTEKYGVPRFRQYAKKIKKGV